VNIVGDREGRPVRFKAVLWDIDGTLVDSESTHINPRLIASQSASASAASFLPRFTYGLTS
jgi:phosphoglycolate phosphatase-like HAD superfamily hydrolase